MTILLFITLLPIFYIRIRNINLIAVKVINKVSVIVYDLQFPAQGKLTIN